MAIIIEKEIAILSIDTSKEEIISIRNYVRELIDNSLNSDPNTKILCELWTSLDDSIKHLNNSLLSLKRLE